MSDKGQHTKVYLLNIRREVKLADGRDETIDSTIFVGTDRARIERDLACGKYGALLDHPDEYFALCHAGVDPVDLNDIAMSISQIAYFDRNGQPSEAPWEGAKPVSSCGP